MHLRAKEFAAAEAHLDEVPYARGERGARQRALFKARLLVDRAYDALRNGDKGQAIELAKAARPFARRARQQRRLPLTEEVFAMVIQDRARYGRYLFARAKEYPLDHHFLQRLAYLMPRSLDVEETRSVAELLLAISNALAPRHQPN